MFLFEQIQVFKQKVLFFLKITLGVQEATLN